MKLLKDSGDGWNRGNIDGLDHGLYALASYIITWFVFSAFIPYVFIVNTIVWLAIEWSQEKKMARGLENKPLEWSQKRHQDWGIPTLVGLIAMGVYYA